MGRYYLLDRARINGWKAIEESREPSKRIFILGGSSTFLGHEISASISAWLLIANHRYPLRRRLYHKPWSNDESRKAGAGRKPLRKRDPKFVDVEYICIQAKEEHG